MKTICTLVLVLVFASVQAQHSLEKIWESDTTLAIPESVLYHEGGLYVSLIDGPGWEADGKGGVGKLDKTGKILTTTWVTGLNAPKGMGIWKNKMYVADISEVAVIDIATAKVESKIAIEGATGLNDITINNKGVVYVSDSRAGKVYAINNGKPELFLSDMKGVNGLKAIGNDIYILTGNAVLKSGPDKKPVTVAPMEIGGDGIEPVGGGNYVVSCWVGVIYYLNKDGKLQQMLDTRDQKKNTADIGYNSAEHIVYVPTFMKKSVVAYKLK